MMTVADIMRKEVVTVPPEATLRNAARIIFSGQVGGLPVVDKKGKLIGIIVEKDIFRLFFPSVQDYVEDYAHTRDFELMEKHISEILNLPVKNFMSKNPLTIVPQTPILKTISIMITKRIRKLPVIDSKNKLVGIISQGDIFRSIVKKNIPSLRSHTKRGVEFFSHFARYFDISFSWNQRLAEEIPFLLSELKKRGAKTVLDVGCGTGEHAIALARRGFKVTGIDASDEMLSSAHEKWGKQKKTVKDNLEFMHLPIRDLSSVKNRRFDAVICIGNMLPNVLDYEKEFLSLKKLLGPKTVFIIQVKNFEEVLDNEERFISLNFSFGETEDDWEKEYAFLRFYNFRPDGLLDFNVETLASDGRIWHSYGVETTLQKPILRKDLVRVLEKLGLPKIRFYGNFKREKYIKEESHKLIAVATR